MATTEELKKIADATGPSTSANAATAGGAATGAVPQASSTALSSAYTDTPWAQEINKMYDAKKESQLSQLESAYKNSVSGYEEKLDALAPSYQVKANDLATQYERNRRNFNQQAIGNGINTGAASQAALAQNANYLNKYGDLRTSQAESEAAINRDIAQLGVQYQYDVKDALAKNDFERAGALMDEYNKAYARAQADAELRAGYGDFSGYAAIYGQEQADMMKDAWLAEHPQLGYMTGQLTDGQYQNLINGRPKNYGLDVNGNRIAGYGAAGGSNSSWYIDAYNAAVAHNASGDAAKEYFGQSPVEQPATRNAVSPAAVVSQAQTALNSGQITPQEYRNVVQTTWQSSR